MPEEDFDGALVEAIIGFDRKRLIRTAAGATATDGIATGDAPAAADAGRPIHPVTTATPLIQIVIGYSTSSSATRH